ncbi:MAG: glycine/sarcosine/betaine reductase component B subunit [Chloroflexota bacterium]
MRLELGTFPVRQARFGDRTRWSDGILEIDRQAVLDIARAEPNLTYADVDLARPGDRARVINVADVIEPRVKVEGPGVCYPGFCGRPITAVGRGRTHRFSGFAVIESADIVDEIAGVGDLIRGGRPDAYDRSERRQDFIDMSGAGAARPYAGLQNLVLTLQPKRGLDAQDRHLATHGVALRVADYLAAAIAGLDPPEREVFDLTHRDPALPGLVYIPVLASSEFRFGPDTHVGIGVYGVTRLSAPWALHPTEMMDGAVSQASVQLLSWPMLNDPIVLELARRHGKDLNFLGVIVHRSNWGGQAEMELIAERDAQLATLLGASGAIVTTNLRGRRFVDTVAAVKACEAEGLNTVLVTEEEDDEGGTATPLLINDRDIVSAVSTGTGAVLGPFRPVERVLGAREPDPYWAGELQPIAGRYGAFHLQDYFGFGRQSCASY